MEKKDFIKTIPIIIGFIMLPHGATSQSLWKDSVEFIKFDQYGYDKIIFYPDCTFLQLYYCNARMDFAEYTFGKYRYNKDNNRIVINSGPNYKWDYSIDTSFSRNDSLMLNLMVGDGGCVELLLIVNDDTIDLSEPNNKNGRSYNQDKKLTKVLAGNTFCFTFKKNSDIKIIDKLSADTVINCHGGPVILNIKMERKFILFSDKYIQLKEKKFYVDEYFNLRNDNGELTYYLFDKTGLKHFPLKQVFDHVKD